MARMVFSEVAGTLSFLRPQCDDDMVDRLHYYYTTSCLLVTAVECWLPAEFQSSWQEYTELMCWSRNTYYVQFQSDIPREEKEREDLMISYYQWTPFFLVLSAFFFYSPCLIWRLFYAKSGIVLKEVVAFAIDPSNIQQRHRDTNLRGISVHLSAAFRHRFKWNAKWSSAGDSTPPEYVKYHRLNVIHNYSLWSRLINLRFFEAYLTFLYLSVKLLFLANVMAQVFIMLWIWYSFLIAFSIFSLFNWLLRMLPSEARISFIARRLELADIDFRRELYAKELNEFVQNYIKMDGVFVLRMLTIHAGVLACTEVVDNLWEEFQLLTAKSKEEDTFADEESTEHESEPRLNETTLQTSCAPRQPLLLEQRRKTPVLAPLMTRNDPSFCSQFHGGPPGETMAAGGTLSMLATCGRSGKRVSSRIAVHRPFTTSMTGDRFNLRPIGFPSRFSAGGGGSALRSSIASTSANEGGEKHVRQDTRGNQHILTAQLYPGGHTTASIPTLSINTSLAPNNGVEEQYLQSVGEQERLAQENEL